MKEVGFEDKPDIFEHKNKNKVNRILNMRFCSVSFV